ncbi:MAG TPA: tyrosine-protein phosphatase [Tepidisphaeraceae bacterium]|jgi:protein tyrosine/serine phosphatase
MTNDPAKPPCCRGKTVALWVCVLAIVLGGGAWVWAEYFQTYHLAVVQEGVLVRDGNRGVREFENALRKTHPKTVVSLIDDQELADSNKRQFKEELDLCKEQRVNIVRIPIKLGGWPTSGDVRKFLDIVQKKENQPVLVHCAQGVRRTGMMVAAFQESILGWDKAKAKATLLTFGHSQRTAKDVERFIDVYDSNKRTVTAQLEQSSEE